MADVDQRLIAKLCPALRAILDRELAAGNEVVRTSKGWPHKSTILVMLRRPFRTTSKPTPAGVVFREINDPHYWKAEYEHQRTGHLLACRFG